MKMQKIEVHIKNTEKWIKLIQEDLELNYICLFDYLFISS